MPNNIRLRPLKSPTDAKELETPIKNSYRGNPESLGSAVKGVFAAPCYTASARFAHVRRTPVHSARNRSPSARSPPARTSHQSLLAVRIVAHQECILHLLVAAPFVHLSLR